MSSPLDSQSNLLRSPEKSADCSALTSSEDVQGQKEGGGDAPNPYDDAQVKAQSYEILRLVGVRQSLRSSNKSIVSAVGALDLNDEADMKKKSDPIQRNSLVSEQQSSLAHNLIGIRNNRQARSTVRPGAFASGRRDRHHLDETSFGTISGMNHHVAPPVTATPISREDLEQELRSENWLNTEVVQATKVNHNFRRWLLVLLVLLLVTMVVGVVVGVVVITSSRANESSPLARNNNGTVAPTSPETNQLSSVPSMAPIANQSPQELLQLLVNRSFDGGLSLEDPASPQFQAYSWLSDNGSNNTTHSNEDLLTRYALATIYFATSGNQWRFNRGWLTESNHCTWTRVRCNLGELRLELFLNKLDGVIPAELALLSNQLVEFDVSRNDMVGTIPSAIGELTRLTKLDVASNQINGTVPSEIGRMSKLVMLRGARNSFTGRIPSDLFRATALETLDFSEANLTGSLPREIGQLKELTLLDLEKNTITGSLPIEFTELTKLDRADLRNCQLTGSLPTTIGSMSSVESLQLLGNRWSGSIPSQIGTLTNLRTLWISNDNRGPFLQGRIPTEFGNLVAIRSLNIQESKVSGPIPTELGKLTGLKALRLRSNLLSGTIPAKLGSLWMLEELRLHENELSGTIPPVLWQLSNLQVATFYSNRNLEGSVPNEFCDLGLQTLEVGCNVSCDCCTGPPCS